jgi:hypothetical protein
MRHKLICANHLNSTTISINRIWVAEAKYVDLTLSICVYLTLSSREIAVVVADEVKVAVVLAGEDLRDKTIE